LGYIDHALSEYPQLTMNESAPARLQGSNSPNRPFLADGRNFYT